MLDNGERIGDWVIDAPLGEGGMGAVYRCHNVLSERVQAAVKVLKPHSMADARERFVREVELLASVQHASVVRVLGCGEDTERGMIWLAMELLEGEELTDRLERDGPLPWSDACRYFVQLGEGLVAAHAKGIVHRDIKPQNIYLCADGTAKLLDFGIAVAKGGTRLTQAGMVPGTVAYMAPEVFEGELPDHRADIYALGQVLWEALTGKQAYPEDGGLTPDQMIVRTMGAKLSAKAMDPGVDFPAALRDLVRRATDPDVDERLSDLTGFVRTLSDTAGNKVAPGLPRRARPRSGAGLALMVAVVGIGLALLVAVGGLVVIGAGGMGALLFARSSAPVAAAPVASSAPVASAGLPSKKIPDGFPFWIADDAKVSLAVKQMPGGVPSYVVSYNTTMDSGALATRYMREAKRRERLKVSRSDDPSSTRIQGFHPNEVLNIDIDWEIDRATSGSTRVTIAWMPEGPP